MSEETDDQSEGSTSETTTVELAESQARALIEALEADEYARAFALFADDVQSELIEDIEPVKELIKPEPERILAECWRAMTNLYGEFETIDGIESKPADNEVVATVTLTCENETFAIDVPVDPSGTITEWAFVGEYEPPTYVDDSQIIEREMAVETDDVTLGATLTLPINADAVPGAVLVHGAGGLDRDYTAVANKILKDLAWGLAMHGIGTLRYDKRSFVEDIPKEDVDFETVVTGDAVTAVDTLATVPEIDADHLFVVGHSLGGTCAPYIASQHDDVAGIVNLDGNCLNTGPDTAVTIVRDYWAQRDTNTEYGQEQLDQMEETAERIKTGHADSDEILLGQPAAWKQHYSEYTSDWLPTTRSLSIPFFIAKTGRFAPRFYAESVDTLRAELPGDAVQISLYEDLNHYFQRGDTPFSIYESANFREPPAEDIIVDVADFLFETVNSSRSE
jgi:dienelactone hydrolase